MLGFIIGHEITHSLDETGFNYNKVGLKTNWWTNESMEKFENLTKCFVRLYDDHNEEWKECGTKCPDTCLNRDIKNRACIKMCVTGCFCRDGFIRLGYDMTGGIGHCVPVDYCDLIQRN